MEDTPKADAPLINWDIPGINGAPSTQISLSAGRVVAFVGPNGAGKSALSWWMSANKGSSPTTVARVIAHRRLWMRSSGAEMTAIQRASSETHISNMDKEASSRTQVEFEDQRAARVIYDLLARVNSRNARLAELVDTGQVPLGVGANVLTTVARVFKAASLDLSFQTSDLSTIDVVGPSGAKYPIQQMSDGEKGALVLAAEVLLAAANTVIMIDEPERHLHRAISADFLTALIMERPDCGFVLFTHDLDLVTRLDPGDTTLCTVTRVAWQDTTPAGWELQVEPGKLDVPDAVRVAILGGRTNLAFVEGANGSLDRPLYNLLFPDRTIVDCGGSDEVKQAVIGLKDSKDYHWVAGRGILDGDARTGAEITALAGKGILVLPVNEIESLYYLPLILDAVAARQASNLGHESDHLSGLARENALKCLKDDNIKHLAAENALKIIRTRALTALPSAKDLPDAETTVLVQIESPYVSQLHALKTSIAASDYGKVVSNYSIKDSSIPTVVARTLRFQDAKDYESAVRALLTTDEALLTQLQEFVGSLP